MKYSIIIPVHNVEKYLNQCIDSVLCQTYNNIEVLLIDDGSTDLSGKICDEYANLDDRVRVLHQQNKGVAEARNAGIKMADGDFVLFIDSDDWMEKDTIAFCADKIKQFPNVNCILFAYSKEYGANSYPKHTFETDLVFNSEKDFRQRVYRRLFGLVNAELSHPESLDYMSTCWGKVYRKKDILNCRFIDIDEVGSDEDGLFNIDVLFNCRSAIYIDSSFYHYRFTKDSLTSKYRPHLIEQWKELFERMQKKIDEHPLSPDFQEALNNRIALSIIGIGMNELSNPKGSFSQFVSYIKNYISTEKYRASVSTMHLKKLPFTWKILLFCCKYRLAFCTSAILNVIRFIKSKL